MTLVEILVNLDSSVDLDDEGVSSEEADRTSEQPEREHHDARVAEVQQGGDQLSDLQLGHEVEDGVPEHVHG